MTHRITAVSISNFKRIRDVQISPPADRSIIVIGGKNAQGKSSLLDAVTTAFGGKRAAPPDPVRHGSSKASITIELDRGELVIEREIEPDGSSKLTVRDKTGVVRAPQAMLDELVGNGRFLDPIAFLYLPAAEQRRRVLQIIGGGQLTTLEDSREKVFALRTELNRDYARAKATFDGLPTDRGDAEQPLDIASLVAERAAFSERQRYSEACASKLAEADRELKRAYAVRGETETEIKSLEARLEVLRARDAELSASVIKMADEAEELRALSRKATAEWSESTPRREAIDRQLANANDHNTRVGAARALRDRRAEAEKLVAEFAAKVENANDKIERLERRKQAVISEAKLPVDELGVAPDHITLKGLPLGQASGAEKLRVALALAIAASPNLQDVWIRDGALLDDDSLRIVEEHAAATGHVIWIERVGSGDDGAIIIQDGKVLS